MSLPVKAKSFLGGVEKYLDSSLFAVLAGERSRRFLPPNGVLRYRSGREPLTLWERGELLPAGSNTIDLKEVKNG